MGSQANSQFRDDEIVTLSHWDKREGAWVETVYPKVGWRLRQAHEDNDQLAISAEVIQYDENIAVVKAVAATRKGDFSGIGMASIERDQKIAPAILELAETRAIARALRFSGYGLEYCSYEEVSHLNGNGNGNQKTREPEPPEKERNGNRQTRRSKYNGNGGENSRLTNKQLNFILNLGNDLGLNSKDLDKETISMFGVKMNHLTVSDASSYIEELKARDEVPF